MATPSRPIDPPGARPSQPPPIARQVPREMAAGSEVVPTIGRVVIYSDRHTLDARPCPAIVTAVRTEGPEAVLALTAFPAGQSPFPVDGVVHVSKAGDHDRCWGWPTR